MSTGPFLQIKGLFEQQGLLKPGARFVPQHVVHLHRGHGPSADEAAVRKLADALAEHGVAADTLHAPDQLIIAMSGLDQEARPAAVAQVKRIADVLKRIGGHILVSHCGGPLHDETTRALQFAAGQESLTEVAAFCRELDLQVAVENSLPTRLRVGDTVAEVVEFVKGIGADNIGYCLDTSHANIGDDAVAAVGPVAHRLTTLHISDNDGKSDQHALPFQGTVDWKRFMAALRAARYEGMFMLEVRATREPRVMLREAKARFAALTEMHDSGSASIRSPAG